MALTLLAGYALLVFWAGFSAKNRTRESFYVNNRASGAWGVGFSILGSCIGASATLGMIGMAFAVGVPAFWWLGAGAVGLVFLALGLAGAVRRSGAYTLPHMVEAFLGKQARPLIALIIVAAWSAILAAQFTALGKMLGPLTGFGPLVCLAIGFVLVCGHTLGGQSAIMRVDRLQAALILASLAAMLAWLTAKNPGWIQSVRLEAINEEFTAEKLCYYLVVVGANYLVCPMLYGRLLSARDERSAVAGTLLGAFGIAVCAALIVAVGLACKGLIPADTAQDSVLTAVLAAAMPPWMHMVVSVALISIIVSSADSCLVTAATVCANDLLGSPSPAVARGCVLAIGAVGAAVSLWGKGILGFLLMAYDIFACGVVAPCLVGLILYPARRTDARFACAAVVVGGFVGAVAAFTGNSDYNYVGMGVSALLALAGARKREEPDSAPGTGLLAGARGPGCGGAGSGEPAAVPENE